MARPVSIGYAAALGVMAGAQGPGTATFSLSLEHREQTYQLSGGGVRVSGVQVGSSGACQEQGAAGHRGHVSVLPSLVRKPVWFPVRSWLYCGVNPSSKRAVRGRADSPRPAVHSHDPDRGVPTGVPALPLRRTFPHVLGTVLASKQEPRSSVKGTCERAARGCQRRHGHVWKDRR